MAPTWLLVVVMVVALMIPFVLLNLTQSLVGGGWHFFVHNIAGTE